MEPHDTLNSYHKRHLLTSAQYVDSLLADIESILTSSLSKSPFPKYQLDITPGQAKLVQDYIARIRTQMIQVLKSQGIVPPEPQLPARRSIRVALDFCDIAFDECRPEAMRGYGELPAQLVPELNGLVDEMKGVLRKLNTYLAQNTDRDLQSRLGRLDRARGGTELLSLLERIISNRGLVELRPALAVILDKLESPGFQIAVFGRVSSGKSSMLNHILGDDILPVGVTPITAVPTRLVYGQEAKLAISYSIRQSEVTALSRLAEFVSEEYNPGNAKHVTRIVATVPSPNLHAGIVLVDTPGLGSLATAGAAETLAYLPQCDLGVVLVDAGSTFTAEDLATVQRLYEAAIPASVLLSKADLLSPEDRERSAKYVSSHIESQLGIELTARPVSTRDEHVRLLDEWFTRDLQPLFRRQRDLSEQSVGRKIAALRDSVQAALKVRLEISGRGPKKNTSHPRDALVQLRRASGEFEELQRFCFRASYEVGELWGLAAGRAAAAVVQVWFSEDETISDEEQLFRSHLVATASEGANQIYERLQQGARSLAHALLATARALENDNAPDENEFLALVKEMPQFDPATLKVDIRRGFLSILGRRLTQRLVQSRVRRQLDQQGGELFRSYGQMVEAWSRRIVSQLHRHYDAQADGYRAQLERLDGGGKSAPEEAASFREDLTLLAEYENSAQMLLGSEVTRAAGS
jgi:GTP-binding protein EngB required for normal cell division